MPTHIVKLGDSMTSIADQYGFFWETLWNHERNAALRAQRRNPNVLAPGDRVFIPEIRPKDESGSTGQTHTFRLKGVPARLNLRLVDRAGRPRAGVGYALEVDGAKTSGKSGADGLISMVIRPRAKRAQLHLETGEKYDLNLGYINPVEYVSGIQARLKNLGFYDGEVTGSLDDLTSEAIRSFQAARGLEATGQADPATRDALLAAHEN